MPGKRRKSKLTFVLIPDAGRPVRRARLSGKWLWIVPLLAAASLSTAAGWITYSKHADASQISALNAQLRRERTSQNQIVQHKENTIEQLQGQIAELSARFDSIANKLSGIRQTEQEVRKLSGLQQPESGNDSSAASHEGGALIPVDSSNRAQALDSLNRSMNDMGNRLNEMQKSLDQLESELKAKKLRLAHTPSIWPVHSRFITSGFGLRRDPFTGQVSFHDGVDIESRLGEPVFATADGVVAAAGYQAERGNYVLIRHGYGLETIYMHLSRIFVHAGQKVDKSQKIGRSGDTGRSTGPHLHYGVIDNGRIVNPVPYLP